MTGLATGGQPADADELYGDLVSATGGEGEALLRAEVEHLRTETSAQAAQIEELSTRLQQLTQEVETLRDEKSVLCTNVSSLYKTAQLEIERKDAEIQRLRASTRR